MKTRLFLCSLALAGMQAMSIVSAQSNCTAGFSYVTGNNGEVTFTNTSTGTTSATNYFWSFGSGSANSSGVNSTYTYQYNGAYGVCLMISNADSTCFSTFCDSIVITNATNPPPPACNALFSLQQNTTTVSFTDASTGNPTSWVWNFGDGNTSALQNPTYQYAGIGTYSVCLTITTGSGSCSYCNNVSIINLPPPACSAAVTIVQDSVAPIDPLKWYIYPTVTGKAPFTYLWSFGDGTTSTEAFPIHSYSVAGHYEICLTTVDANSCTSNTCNSSYRLFAPGIIKDLIVVNTLSTCQAGFTFTENNGAVTFTNTSTGGTASDYRWNFGDGQSAEWVNNTTHTYQNIGTYTVCLTMGDSLNLCKSAFCGTVVITNVPALPPVVNISGNTTISTGGSTVLTASVDSAYSCKNISYVWSTGATTASITVAPTVTTSYTVTATNACVNCCVSGTKVITVTVSSSISCSAGIFIAKDSSATPNPLLWYIYPTVTGKSPFTYLWSFGDGTTSTQPYPTHSYSVAGHYAICLTITDAGGCTSTTCDSSYRLSAPGIIKDLIVVNPTGIEENSTSVNSIFPNPSNEMVEVSLSQVVQGELTITDMMGREVYRAKINSNNMRVNVSSLAVGCYNLSIVSEAKTIHNKIMIAR
ncbi:MAG: PKD domain-containing protein [Bacteroidota bacterium]